MLVAFVGLGLGACGLSLALDGLDPPPAEDASIPERDARPPSTNDTGPPVEEDAAIPTDGALADAPNVDAAPDAGTCTPVLTEAFDTDGGAFVLYGQARREGGKLAVLPRSPDGGSTGGAYVAFSAPLTRFVAKITLSTDALAGRYATADGLAVHFLEKALPESPTIAPDANDLGMTLDPTDQHGYGVLLDIFPPGTEARYLAANELGPNARDIRDKLVSFTTTGATSFVVTVYGLGNGEMVYDVVSPLGSRRLAVPFRPTSPKAPSFVGLFVSAAAGVVGSPGFYVDDLSVSTCTP